MSFPKHAANEGQKQLEPGPQGCAWLRTPVQRSFFPVISLYERWQSSQRSHLLISSNTTPPCSGTGAAANLQRTRFLCARPLQVQEGRQRGPEPHPACCGSAVVNTATSSAELGECAPCWPLTFMPWVLGSCSRRASRAPWAPAADEKDINHPAQGW